MKTNNLTFALLLLPALVWGQAEGPMPDDMDLSDVVVVEDDSTDEPEPEAETVDAAEATVEADVAVIPPDEEEPVVVEIPDEEVEGARIDAPEPEEPEDPDVPEVTTALPADSDVVLELPGQEGTNGEAVRAEEETISVDFADEDVRTILRNVADLFDLNLVIPDTLQGRTSIKLRNITWRQVFEVVLDPLGFTFIEDRNIIRIKSIEELTTEPVDTRVFVVNYARAEELQSSIAPLVDSALGGRIQVDTRSNALVITERPSRMNKIQEIIDRLDKATDQVMIESRFVEVSNQDIKNIGVNWTSLSGYGVGVNDISREFSRERSSSDERDVTDDQQGTTTTTTTSSSLAPSVTTGEQEVVSDIQNITDSLSTASTSRIDTAVFSADDFRVVLSALKENTDSKLISNPTVVVMNNQEAEFKVGEDFPVREIRQNQETGAFEAGEVEKEFIGISLRVRPSVNAAGVINLTVSPELSNLDRVIENFGAIDPVIAKRTVDTNVAIKDGFTLALGGLSSTEESNSGTKVPLLGDLPGLGRLFRSDSKQYDQQNLIVFITAKTLNPDGSDYREIIDPRTLDSMGITEDDVPGYGPTEAELEAIRQSEQLRLNQSRARRLEKLRRQIQALEGLNDEAKESSSNR